MNEAGTPLSGDEGWIADTVGGRVTRFEEATAGRSRGTWLVDVERPDGGRVDLVLRRDTGDGPLSGTELNLAREARVYRALDGTKVAIPQLYGVAPDREALIVERIVGTEDLNGLASDERAQVIDDFMRALAELHSVDVADLDLAGFARPQRPEEHALADVALWRRIFDEHVERPAPLYRLAFTWLAANPPADVERTVLCHGDCGPGNFLHADGRVTAILDWEFAHLGDPMDDLAWFTIRASQLGVVSDVQGPLNQYAGHSGIDLAPDRIRYYQLLVLVRMGVSCLVALGRRSGRMDRSTYFVLLPLLERQITTLLAEQLGVTLTATEMPTPTPPTARGEVIGAISTELGSSLMTELESPAARSRAMGMALLLSHLSAADTWASVVDAADLDDLTELLGRRPSAIAEGHRTLEATVDDLASERVAALLGYFSRHADRQVALWPVLAGLASRPLPKVEPT